MRRLHLVILAALIAMLLAAPAWAAPAGPSFREQNDLVHFDPPEWFFKGHFVAREVQPRYLFGSVADFAKGLGQTIWFIEQPEQERRAKEGNSFEYTVYLEQTGPSGPRYWVFVMLPHKSA